MSKEEKLLDYLKRVTAELQQTKERLRQHEEKDREPIAIVGMACRYAGGADAPESLWDIVTSEKDVVSTVPADRGWDLEKVYDPDIAGVGTTYTIEGGFLHDVAGFDSDFFDITRHEALVMDPQQRLILETAWEACERAQLDPTTLKDSKTGVFFGAVAFDYGSDVVHMPDGVAGFVKTGRLGNMLSGRVAYTLGLRGPALTLDTGCSSSLVTLHLACQALRARDCSLALAGGAMIYSTPEVFIEFSRFGVLSREGRCKSYSSSGNGMGWGEGVGMLLLERLSDARHHGHPILAVICGSACTQDGRSNGILAPNGLAQEDMIRHALSNAGIPSHYVDVVEGHGTGTLLGDAIEVRALLATYGRKREHPLWLGSIKSNIGHSQAAAGIAGVIKMVMAIRHGLLPKTLHIDQPVPHVDWSSNTVQLLTEARPWPETGRPRRAAVSGTGISGTNAHVILEQAPDENLETLPENAQDPDDFGMVPWVISGKSAAALRAQAQRLLAFLHVEPEHRAIDIAYSLATTRTAFKHRAAILADDRDNTLRALKALAAGEPAPGLLIAPSNVEGTTGLTSQSATTTRAYLQSARVNWQPIFAGSGARRITLPVYAFQRERFWLYDRSRANGETEIIGGLRRENFEYRDPMMVAGITTRTNNEAEFKGAAKIPDLHALFIADHLEEKLTKTVGNGTVRAVYTDYESDFHGDYTYLLGYEVEDMTALPEGIEIRQWPASKYAVFTSGRGPLRPTLVATWRQILAMEEAGQLGGKRTYIGDFEVHESSRPNPQEIQARIYVGIE